MFVGSPISPQDLGSNELSRRIRAAAEADSEIRADLRSSKRLHGRSPLFGRSDLAAAELEDAARLKQVMDGARSRFDLSDEVNLAILASEIVDRGLRQPSLYTTMPTTPEALRGSGRQPQLAEGNREWRMYDEVACQGLSEDAPGADWLRNELAAHLRAGAQQGVALEASLRQLGEGEHAVRHQQQQRIAYAKEAAAMAREAVDAAERRLIGEITGECDSEVSKVRGAMASHQQALQKLQHGCSSSRRLLTAFCGSQYFSGTELEVEASVVSRELQQAVGLAKECLQDKPAPFTASPSEVDMDSLVSCIRDKFVFKPCPAPAVVSTSRKVWELQLEALLVVPLSVWPLKRPSVLHSLATQLRVPEDAIEVTQTSPDSGCTALSLAIRSGADQLKHASALALLDMMKAGAQYGGTEWAHVTVSRIWNLKQHQTTARIGKPVKTVRYQLHVEGPSEEQFEEEVFLQAYSEAIQLPALCVQLLKVEKSLLSKQSLVVLVSADLESETISIPDLTNQFLLDWKVKRVALQAPPEPIPEPLPVSSPPPAAAEDPTVQVEWLEAITELEQSKSEAIQAEDFSKAHQLKTEIEALRQKAPVVLQIVLLGGWLGVDWREQLAADIAAAVFCEVGRVQIRSLEALCEEEQELDLISFELQAAELPGEPSPSQLKATFTAQVKNKASRLYKGVLTRYTVYEYTIRRLLSEGGATNQVTLEGFLATARAIFDEKDLDCSGEIEHEELAGAIQSLWGSIGNPIAGSELESEVAESLRKFDADNSGSLSFTEFMQMLCEQPWLELLPATVRPHVSRVAEQLKSASAV